MYRLRVLGPVGLSIDWEELAHILIYTPLRSSHRNPCFDLYGKSV